MNKQIKIFYDCFYFEEVAIELQKTLQDILTKLGNADKMLTQSGNADVEMVHLLDSPQEKKKWENTIYFCFGMNRWLDMRNLPPNYVVMQFEPISVRGLQSENYLIICVRAMAVFEYSRLNMKIYREFNIPKKNIYLFEVGVCNPSHKTGVHYSENNLIIDKNPNEGNMNNNLCLKMILEGPDSESKKDVDILFIGNITEYRQTIISNLRKKYPTKNIQIFEKVWGQTRDRLVERSNIVLNLHADRESVFPLETPRLLYLCKFDVHIVSEYSGDLNEEKRWAPRVHFSDNDFDIITNIFEDKNFVSKKNGKVPRLCSRLLDFLNQNNINVQCTIENESLNMDANDFNIGRWFDIECKIFESLNLEDERLPNIHGCPLSSLPNVSIITLTTPERLNKWKDLMMWNNRHRVYQPHKLEWIIVLEKPQSKFEIRNFNKIKNELNRCIIKPNFIFYENRPKEVYLQITEKRNLALERCRHEFVDLMDDDDIEMPDALKIKMIVLETYQKKCVGSKSIMCIDKNKNIIFVMNSHFPTESTLTFHKSFCGSGFSPSVHGEGSLMVLSQHNMVIDIPSSLNLIAITHDSNITGHSRKSDLEVSSTKGFLKNLKMFLDDKKANELYEIIF